MIKIPEEVVKKVYRVSKYSYAIILPKSWLARYGITENTYIKVKMGGKLEIVPVAIEELK